jgi:hypothetical protein
VWDKRGKLVVAVIDQFFCDTEYRRVLDSMLDPQQWYWEDEPAATHRMRQDIEGIGPRNNGAKPGRHHRPELYNYNDTRDSPSLLGNAADAAFEDQVHENIKTCMRQTLPSDVLRSTDSLVYRRGYGSIAHLEPDGVSPVQSAPHVGAFDFVSEYTVTPDRRFERAGTIFVEQKGTGVFQVRTEAQRRAFYEANREIQRIAVEDEGQPYASGWMNASETRWGVGKLMVYNRANRIFFYPQGRPHNDFLPRRSMLSPTSEKGRMLLKSFWSIEN